MINDTSEYYAWTDYGNSHIKVTCWTGENPVNAHRHDFIELAFLAYGSCVHSYRSSDVHLIPGDIFIITPHEKHSYAIESKTVIYNCLFYPQALGGDWERLKEIKSIYDLLVVEPFYRLEAGKQEIIHLEPLQAQQVEAILKTMIAEQEGIKNGYELACKSYLTILLCLLGRAWNNQTEIQKAQYHGKRELLAKAVDYIESHISSEMKVSDIASMVYMSPGNFRKIFKEATGLTPIEYINGIRITMACKLLGEQKLSISEIAERVGIGDLNYFSRIFKAQTGCSPTEYKKRNDLC